MKKGLLFLLLLFLAMALSGCAAIQLENRVLVVGMGLDLAEDGCVKLSIQISNATPSQGGQSGQSDSQSSGEKDPNKQEGYSIITAQGQDWFDVLTAMRGISTHILNFTQLRAIIVSEKLSQDKMLFHVLSDIYLMPQMRSNTYVLVAMGEALEFLQNNKPDIGVSLSKYLDIAISNTVNKGYAPNSTIGELVRDKGSAGQTGAAPVIMLGAVVKEKKNAPDSKRNPHDLLPDKLTSEGSSAIRLMGAAVTDGEKVVGYLTGYEVQLLTVLRGDAEEVLCYTSGGSVITQTRRKTRLSIQFGSPDVLVAKVSLVSFAQPGQANPVTEVADIFKRDLTKLIEKLQNMGVDSIGFGTVAIRGFDTISRWETYDWVASHFTSADIQIEVEVMPMLSII